MKIIYFDLKKIQRVSTMFKCSHRTLIFFAGFVWLLIGIFLLSLGITFIMQTLKNPMLAFQLKKFSILLFARRFFSDPSNAVILLLSSALFLGFIKGRFALAKSVQRQLKRVQSLPNPASLKYLYSKGYYFLIGGMILLGILLRFCPITLDTRGWIDVIIGSALINGSMLFFRSLTTRSPLPKKEI